MFEIKKLDTNSFTFQYYTANKQLLLTGNTYNSREEVEKSIKAFQQIKGSGFIERKTKPNGKFYFVLKNKQGKVAAESREYSSESGMDNEILLLTSGFTDAEIT